MQDIYIIKSNLKSMYDNLHPLKSFVWVNTNCPFFSVSYLSGKRRAVKYPLIDLYLPQKHCMCPNIRYKKLFLERATLEPRWEVQSVESTSLGLYSHQQIIYMRGKGIIKLLTIYVTYL